MSDSLLKTPLYDLHIGSGARMVEFNGWSMPLSFTGINDEHVHTRTACSLFDVSHMGRLTLTGPDGEMFLDRLCTRNLQDAEVGRSYYTHICREDGGILDDMIVSRFEEHWGIVCNAGNRGKIIAWLEEHRAGYHVEIKDETQSTAMVAIQGPKTMEIAKGLISLDPTSLKRYRFTQRGFLGMSITIYRSGYTGEDGLEVVLPAGIAKMLAPQLVGTPEKPHPVVKPAGLGARDTLRIEAAMPLYGHELSEEVDSLTAGQGWCVDLDKDFIGVEAMRRLKEKGLTRRLVGLELDGRRIARQHHGIHSGGQEVGVVTSGTYSPTLGKSIAMAFVDTENAMESCVLEVDIRGRRIVAKVVKLPFYKRPKA